MVKKMIAEIKNTRITQVITTNIKTYDVFDSVNYGVDSWEVHQLLNFIKQQSCKGYKLIEYELNNGDIVLTFEKDVMYSEVDNI